MYLSCEHANEDAKWGEVLHDAKEWAHRDKNTSINAYVKLQAALNPLYEFNPK